MQGHHRAGRLKCFLNGSCMGPDTCTTTRMCIGEGILILLGVASRGSLPTRVAKIHTLVTAEFGLWALKTDWGLSDTA